MRGPAGRRRQARVLVGLVVLLGALVAAPAAQAQSAPPGVAVAQGYGFATVSWGGVAGATEYQIERTPVTAGVPTGPGVTVGRWLPGRYSAQGRPGGELTFADSGFTPGASYSWRVRALVGAVIGDWSAPVEGTTQSLVGPSAFLTPFEQSGGARWTTHDEEVAYLNAVAAASPRVRLTEVGRTAQNRPLYLATVGAPAPKQPAGIRKGASAVVECTIHGGERAPREACMILLRWLAFSNDPWVEKILDKATVLIYPTANPDGQATGTRENTAGQDLNRDHILIRHPETFAMAKIIRDHKPQFLLDGHELGSGPDLQWLWPRSPGIPAPLWDLTQNHMTRGASFDASGAFGWSSGIWPTHRQDNWETLIHNTVGLKNMVGQLEESPQQSGAARPNAPNNSPANMQRRVYSHLWGFRQHLDYHNANLPAIKAAIAAAEAANSSNAGPLYLDGARDVPVPPPQQEPSTLILDPAPCGYRLTADQLAIRASSTPSEPVQWVSATVAERLAAHGVEVDKVGRYTANVLLAQPLRALVPYILDPSLDESTVRPLGVPNISMVEAERLADRRPTVVVGGTDTGVPNRVDNVGCSLNDLVADEAQWPGHSAFMKHLEKVLFEFRFAGLLSQSEAATITAVASSLRIGS